MPPLYILCIIWSRYHNSFWSIGLAIYNGQQFSNFRHTKESGLPDSRLADLSRSPRICILAISAGFSTQVVHGPHFEEQGYRDTFYKLNRMLTPCPLLMDEKKFLYLTFWNHALCTWALTESNSPGSPQGKVLSARLPASAWAYGLVLK